jgi:5-methylthioribose kinase
MATPIDPESSFFLGAIIGTGFGWLSAILYAIHHDSKVFEEEAKKRETIRHTKELVREEMRKAFELNVIQDARTAREKEPDE